jgi:formylglycine-generating enzyme required for sulfatase activity
LLVEWNLYIHRSQFTHLNHQVFNIYITSNISNMGSTTSTLFNHCSGFIHKRMIQSGQAIKTVFCFMLVFLLLVTFSKANNVIIGAPTVAGSVVTFTIQWDNSWNIAGGPANNDAVWCFIKYQDCATNLYLPVVLSAAGNSVTGPLAVTTVADNLGVFIARSAVGGAPGNNAVQTVSLTMSFADAGYNYQVFGIEMVNVPAGNFYIGDGTRGSSNYGFSDGLTCGAGPWNPLLITNAIQTAGLGLAANYQCNSWGSSNPLPAAFPLGYNRFYCMKYEISQEQYMAFLNTLTYDQQTARTATSPNAAAATLAIAAAANPCRNGIKIQNPGTINNIPAVYGCDLNANGIYNETGAGTTDGQNIACNWLSWPDVIAYMDWAALRPLTEFEFEKVCRGPAVPTASENAWSTTNLLQAISTALTNASQTSEVSSSAGSGLCAYGANVLTDGPLRVGFAATGLTTRLQAGSGYYGAMDLSGNVDEQCVGGYNFNFSAFTNANGDGSLSALGLANTAGWPSQGGGQFGGVSRGSDWFTANAPYLNVSDRQQMVLNYNQSRDYRCGGRGGRSW